MGFKHVVSANIHSIHPDSETISIPSGSIDSYPSGIVGEGSDSTLEIRSTYGAVEGGGYGKTILLMFDITSVPSNATITKIWCDISVYAYMSGGSVTRDFSLLKIGSDNTKYLLSTKTVTDSRSGSVETITAQADNVLYFPTALEIPNILLKGYYYSASSYVGLQGGATLFVEYEDDTPDTHGIFNLILPR